MEMKDFFKFGSKLILANFQAVPVGLKEDENGNSDHLNLIKGNYDHIDFPVTFKQEDGKKLNDILDTGYAGFYLISEKMKIIIEENELTGWKIFPIKLYDKKGNKINGYHGFSITGNSSSINYKKSEINEKKLTPNGPICKFYKGIFIDKWDGTDFFTPEGTYQTLISRKAAQVIKKNKLTNICLRNFTDIEILVDN